MHYLLLISDNEQMCFQAELLMRSIMYFSPKDIKNNFSVVVNGNKSGSLGNCVSLSKYNTSNSFINKNAEVFCCNYHWIVPTPSRWFLEPKDKNCVLIDSDMIACKDLTPLYDLKKDCFYGVPAFKIPMTQREWSQIGFFNKIDFLNYFNFGMLVVPSDLMRVIGEMMLNILPVILKKFKKYEYFSAQVALAYILKNLQVKKEILSKNFNFYDINQLSFVDDKSELDDIIFLHYMKNRRHFVNLKDSIDVKHNEVTKKISSLVNILFNNN